MKILPVNNNYSQNQNTNFKSINKLCKYSITSLISSSSLFMLSNAVDTFKSEKVGKELTSSINTTASILGIAGTFMGLIGITKIENEKLDEND